MHQIRSLAEDGDPAARDKGVERVDAGLVKGAGDNFLAQVAG